MAWTDTARRQHMRKGPRYPSDLRDGEWALIDPMFPAARSGGRPRTTCLRAVMDAILYIGSSGCAWAMLPKCFPPVSTVRGYFYAWRDSGLLTTINHLLVMTAREIARSVSATTRRNTSWLFPILARAWANVRSFIKQRKAFQPLENDHA